MQNIAVFCGSSTGTEASYISEAQNMGNLLASKNIGLVYGGAKRGIMGIIADAVLNKKGKVIGVIPGFLNGVEIAHTQLTELIVVKTMHERKLKMHQLSDGFIMLPGGIGTLEEFFEILTWAQLGLHKKPIGILNTAGYYNDLIDLLDQMVVKGFLGANYRNIILISKNCDELLHKMENYKAPPTPQWITEENT